MKLIVFALLLFCVDFSPCQADEEYETIQNALKSLNDIVVKYDADLDGSAKFPELQAAIDGIAASMENYRGRAKVRLPRIKSLNEDARLEYGHCAGPVYEWCTSMNGILDLYMKKIDIGMSAQDRKYAWKLAGRLLKRGYETAAASLETLKGVQNKAKDLKLEFELLLADIQYDFGEEGEYGKMKKELGNRLDIVGKFGTIFENQSGPLVALSVIFTIACVIIAGPIGAALGLLTIFAAVGLAISLEMERQTIKFQLDTINLLFNTLDRKTRDAIKIAKGVQTALAGEESNLWKLKGCIEAARANRIGLLAHNESWRRDLKPSFKKLGESCLSYTITHGLALEVSNTNKRTRRAANDAMVGHCEASQLAVKEMVGAPLQNNTHNHEVFKSLDRIARKIPCGSALLLTTARKDISKKQIAGISNEVRHLPSHLDVPAMGIVQQVLPTSGM